MMEMSSNPFFTSLSPLKQAQKLTGKGVPTVSETGAFLGKRRDFGENGENLERTLTSLRWGVYSSSSHGSPAVDNPIWKGDSHEKEDQFAQMSAGVSGYDFNGSALQNLSHQQENRIPPAGERNHTFRKQRKEDTYVQDREGRCYYVPGIEGTGAGTIHCAKGLVPGKSVKSRQAESPFAEGSRCDQSPVWQTDELLP
jgi:hypothetical protein